MPFFFFGNANLRLAAVLLGDYIAIHAHARGAGVRGSEERHILMGLLFKRPEFEPIMHLLLFFLCGNSLQRDNDVHGKQPKTTEEGKAEQWTGHLHKIGKGMRV